MLFRMGRLRAFANGGSSRSKADFLGGGRLAAFSLGGGRLARVALQEFSVALQEQQIELMMVLTWLDWTFSMKAHGIPSLVHQMTTEISLSLTSIPSNP